MKEQRKFVALRAHIDDLLKNGAEVVGRYPFTIRVNGRLLRAQHGMLIGYSAAA
ncbi:hypothetical protein [Aquipseudomonas guryensis]|jgi:hypothetical protein|uniref:Uncharacterized protein n=1 Tax=Aquipseudomonas guryensis TaxID=2759165 RepID=A0A7W4DEP2_9GAMM|nr:hypothetical protein [Pseudomonas guryensis]MBB1521194.1 hypothetical protein [Pseudomonas guryensis]